MEIIAFPVPDEGVARSSYRQRRSRHLEEVQRSSSHPRKETIPLLQLQERVGSQQIRRQRAVMQNH